MSAEAQNAARFPVGNRAALILKNRSDQTADAEASAAGVDTGDADAVGLINGVDYHTAANIDGNVAGIADQITGFSLGIADAAAGITLRTGVVFQ